MLLLSHQSMAKRSLLPAPPPPPPPLVDFGNRIAPSILLIIVILAVIFFVSGLLHLFVRYFLRSSNRVPEATVHATAFQGELQQLFQLHDAGVDQAFIDALPVFQYKSIAGVKDPFDCAVCLCEFEAEDKLRLLPKCSHAFHIQCIDAWLLSHSTCPLCRASLLHDLSLGHSSSSMSLVHESGGESSSRENGFGSQRRESVSIDDVGDETAAKEEEIDVAVKLGKFRSVEIGGSDTQGDGGGSSSSREVDQRRCFSMGAHEYVMEERPTLRVSIKPVKSTASFKKPGARIARSEYDCNSRREGFNGFDAARNSRGDERNAHNLHDGLPKRESFSVSKIWLQQRKEEAETRRAMSFRSPAIRSGKTDLKLKQSSSPFTMDELNDSKWQSKNVSELELDSDVEAGGGFHDGAVSRVDETPSFARRTLLWITGRQNKVDNCV